MNARESLKILVTSLKHFHILSPGEEKAIKSIEATLDRLQELEKENVLLRQNNHSLEQLMKRPELELVRENIQLKRDNDILLINECSSRQENKQLDKVLKILKEDFEVTDFDEFLPKNRYYGSEEKQNFVREMLK